MASIMIAFAHATIMANTALTIYGDGREEMPVWPPAVAESASVMDLHREYGNIFESGNRNAASHLWASFLIDRQAQMIQSRFEMFFTGFCAISGSPLSPRDFNRYQMTLPFVGGGESTGYMYYCCWPCVCDTNDFIRVDTLNVTLADGIERTYHVAVIGDPCERPEALSARCTLLCRLRLLPLTLIPQSLVRETALCLISAATQESRLYSLSTREDQLHWSGMHRRCAVKMASSWAQHAANMAILSSSFSHSRRTTSRMRLLRVLFHLNRGGYLRMQLDKDTKTRESMRSCATSERRTAITVAWARFSGVLPPYRPLAQERWPVMRTAHARKELFLWPQLLTSSPRRKVEESALRMLQRQPTRFLSSTAPVPVSH